MTMVSMVVGAVSDDGATFVTKVGTGPVRIKYSVNADMSSASFSASTAVDAQKVAKVGITGLTANTRFFWQVEDNGTVDTSATGQFLTHPVAAGTAASFVIGLSSCSGEASAAPGSGTELDPDRISNHRVFATMRTQALAEDWLAFLHMGDLHYYDFGNLNTDSNANRRRSYDDVLAQSRQHALYRSVPWIYLWDDHDFGADNSDGTYANKSIPAAIYRERVPHYDLEETTGPIYHSWQIGRVLFVGLDVRYNRSPNGNTDNSSKTMLGSTQKAWLENLLDTSTAAALVLISGSTWPGGASGTDTWSSFSTERTELIEMFETYGWSDRMVLVHGDRHNTTLDDGTGINADYGGFPVYCFGSLDSTPSTNNAFDALWTYGGKPTRGQYGTLRIDDNGTDVAITATAYTLGQAWAWHTFTTSTTVNGQRGPRPLAIGL